MFKKLKLSTKILLLGILIVSCFTMVFAWLYPTLKDNMYRAKEEKTRHVVESAWSIIDYFGRKSVSGELDDGKARELAMDAIRSMRYGGNEYYWINDTDGVMIMHPINSKLDNTSVINNKDDKGKFLFREMVTVAKSEGEGLVDYWWPKPGEKEASPKISFVKLYPKWNWIVGSGIYVDDVQKQLWGMFIVIALVGLGIAILAIVLSIIMSRSISKPIYQIIDGLDKSSEQVSAAASQVSTSSQTLAEGSSEQSSSIEETSSSIEQMSAMTKQNAEHSGRADEFMKESIRIVNEANGSMIELTESMGEITHASDEMSKIIKTIEEIAFQTNLLALNAAVEAARAGNAGAGFAVVAGEVRNLAIRAADAAKSTSEMLEETVSKISNGASIVAVTNDAFVKVSEHAAKVGDLISEIAVGSGEQAQGIDQINQAVAQIGQVVQENAANAEESASASEEMSAQAEHMKGIVGELYGIVAGTSTKEGDDFSSHLDKRNYSHGPVRAKSNHGAGNVKKSENFNAGTTPDGDSEFMEF